MSRTSIAAPSSVRSTRSSTRPPSGVNFTALPTRLSRSCTDAAAIALDADRPVAREEERHALAIRAGMRLVERVGRDRLEVGVLDAEHEAARLEARGEQQVVDESQQPVGAARDDLDVAAPLFVERRTAVVVERELDVADDRRQRRAQIVGDERDELVLQEVSLDELFVLLDELARESCRPCRRSRPYERRQGARWRTAEPQAPRCPTILCSESAMTRATGTVSSAPREREEAPAVDVASPAPRSAGRACASTGAGRPRVQKMYDAIHGQLIQRAARVRTRR